MSRDKQYSILDQNGDQAGSVWATSVEPRDRAIDGFWFKRDGHIVGSAWYGYRDVEAETKVFAPKPHPAPTSEVPA
jgi:hypothetical protein